LHVRKEGYVIQCKDTGSLRGEVEDPVDELGEEAASTTSGLRGGKLVSSVVVGTCRMLEACIE
jgi:hypothetical protein